MTTDILLGIILILLFVAVIASALWPPHRHRFTKHLNTDAIQGVERRACVCGKTRFFRTAKAEETTP